MGVYNYLQFSFATGVISRDVAARVDLEKYQAALLEATNVYIRPYGGLYKRPGSIFCGRTKHNDKKSILLRFTYSSSECYLLEIGEKYIRIWLNGIYQGIEIETDFLESDLPNLRFTQSADVMYMTCKRLPVKTLSRYGHTDWRFENLPIYISPFMPINLDEENTVTASKTIGDVTITSIKDLFTPDLVGSQMKIVHDMASRDATISFNNESGTKISEKLLCGSSWSLISRGGWHGDITLQESKDGITWENRRTFSSKNDFNINTNEVVKETVFVRFMMVIYHNDNNYSSCTLTSYSYNHDGVVEITAVENSKKATGTVVKRLGSTNQTDLWYLSAWSDRNKYPACVSFFQDRLTFAGTEKQSFGAWHSKSGDYPNFEVKSADGKLTDDSAIGYNIIAREKFDICHIVPAQDLVFFTTGDEWVINGGSILKPTEINPRVQTSYGSSNVIPLFIGNRILYVQRRGGKIRDMGYSYESDNYMGDDLTIFIQHLTDHHYFRDSTYSQEPDSMVYFVRDDGVMLCLTYMREQNVFAWSVLETKGQYESVTAVPEVANDVVYTVVKREINGVEERYIEKFVPIADSDYPADYVVMDSAMIIDNVTRSKVITGLDHIKGEKVHIIGDDNLFVTEGYVVSQEGALELPYPCEKIIVGLPYQMKVEFPDIHGELKGSGSTHGKKKTLNKAILRLENSFGGQAYATDENRKRDIFTTSPGGGNILETDLKLRLLTKYEEVNPGQDTNHTAKLVIIHEEPFPFRLSSISREVALE